MRHQSRQFLAPRGLPPTAIQARRAHRLSGVHSHGCAVCDAYYTDGCTDPLADGLCNACEGLPHGRASWDRDRDPVTCCRASSVPATAKQMDAFRLGGTRRWWICLECCRTQVYNPAHHLITPAIPDEGADA